MLTFFRTGELRGALWHEFDLKKKEWSIPAERMKMKKDHLVPLSDQAIRLLKQLKPMSENIILFALYRMGYHKKATGHGFRATASTILNETGFNPDAIERQLAHVPQNKIRAAYNKPSICLKELK